MRKKKESKKSSASARNSRGADAARDYLPSSSTHDAPWGPAARLRPPPRARRAPCPWLWLQRPLLPPLLRVVQLAPARRVWQWRPQPAAQQVLLPVLPPPPLLLRQWHQQA